MKNKPILHLNLISRFYQMIELGIKTEEYREQKPYWDNFFKTGKVRIKGKYYDPYDVINYFNINQSAAIFYIICWHNTLQKWTKCQKLVQKKAALSLRNY